jgi:hypothetical protein
MNSRSCVAVLVSSVVFGVCCSAIADDDIDQLVQEANQSIETAAVAVEEARVAIENGKQLVAQIPADSALIGEVRQMLKEASDNWTIAVSSLEGAKQSASKIASASSMDIAKDYKLLATVNARVAFAGAKVVETGLYFVDSVANNKTESLGIIRLAMQDSLAAASQVQFSYQRVKELIASKYSN